MRALKSAKAKIPRQTFRREGDSGEFQTEVKDNRQRHISTSPCPFHSHDLILMYNLQTPCINYEQPCVVNIKHVLRVSSKHEASSSMRCLGVPRGDDSAW